MTNTFNLKNVLTGLFNDVHLVTDGHHSSFDGSDLVVSSDAPLVHDVLDRLSWGLDVTDLVLVATLVTDCNGTVDTVWTVDVRS